MIVLIAVGVGPMKIYDTCFTDGNDYKQNTFSLIVHSSSLDDLASIQLCNIIENDPLK